MLQNEIWPLESELRELEMVHENITPVEETSEQKPRRHLPEIPRGLMDGWVRVLHPFKSISVISRRWKGEHERLCAMKRRLGSGRISPPAGFEPATLWSEVGSTNRSATRTLQIPRGKSDHFESKKTPELNLCDDSSIGATYTKLPRAQPGTRIMRDTGFGLIYVLQPFDTF